MYAMQRPAGFLTQLKVFIIITIIVYYLHYCNLDIAKKQERQVEIARNL
jgi:F0F1-type ATP synthase membrane subunit b/b'